MMFCHVLALKLKTLDGVSKVEWCFSGFQVTGAIFVHFAERHTTSVLWRKMLFVREFKMVNSFGDLQEINRH